MYPRHSRFLPPGVHPVRAAGAWLRRGQLGPVDVHHRIRARGNRDDGPYWRRG